MKFRFANQEIVGLLGVIVMAVSLCGCRLSRGTDKIPSDRRLNDDNRWMVSCGRSLTSGYERSVIVGRCVEGMPISNIGNNLVRAPREENRAEPSDSETLGSLRPTTCFSSLQSHESVVKTCERKGDSSIYALSSERDFQSPFAAPFSTFSLDVDTFGYGVMRRMLNKTGLAPAKQSIRVEEYVNSFNYDYPDPRGDCPIALACEIGGCPWNITNALLRVGVQAKHTETGRRSPCNLVFLIDVSGSMRGEDRLELIRYGLHKLIEKLQDDDRVAIVTYAEESTLVLPSTRCKLKSEIRRVIDSLRADGCTNGGDGIQLAYREAEREFDTRANNRIVLLTDGDFNVGVTEPDELENLIEKKRDNGVFLSVFGVGTGNSGDARMKRLANHGNGNYAFLGDRRDAERYFAEELEGTLFTVAKDVKLQLEFNPAHVAGYRLLGYGCRKLEDKDFGNDQKDAGDIQSGKSMTAFYEIVPAREARTPESGAKYQRLQLVPSEELMSVKLRYKLPNESTSKEQEFAFSEKDIRPKVASTDFVFASAVAEYALLLSESSYRGSASFDSVIERAKSAKGVDADCSRAEFVLLAQKAKAFAESQRDQR